MSISLLLFVLSIVSSDGGQQGETEISNYPHTTPNFITMNMYVYHIIENSVHFFCSHSLSSVSIKLHIYYWSHREPHDH